MFKHAAEKNASRPLVSAGGFSKAQSARQSSTAALNPVSGNPLKRPASHTLVEDQPPQKQTLARSNSGLARVLSASNGFDDYVPPQNKYQTDSAQNSYDKYTSAPYTLENSFEESFDPEEEILYPDLSHLAGGNGAIPPSSVPIPWSSSPVEHKESKQAQINLNSFRFNQQSVTTKKTEQNPRAKRRHLPWEGVATEDVKTPARNSSKAGSEYAWDVSASIMRKQRKTLQDLNKQRVKTTVKEDTEMKAIESKKKSRYHKIFLSDEQQAVLDLVVQGGKSIFFTGSAGTGKSVLLREIIAALREKYKKDPDRIAITASTGLAACNIGGITLHSFAGIGLGNSSTHELIKKVKRNQKAKHRWLRTKVLIIDEVSMVDGDMFDKLEEIARTLKNSGRPFGGIQVIITGDFFQLPPVPERGRQAKFAFHANTWNTAIEKTIALHKVFRQKDPGM
jgi:DNA replication protein DnaC